MTYDTDLEVPPVRPEPEPPLKTPCVNGPWHGATITHERGDWADRATNGGVYRLDAEAHVWRWVQGIF